MSQYDYQIRNVNFSLGLDFYKKASYEMDNLANNANAVQDNISIGQRTTFENYNPDVVTKQPSIILGAGDNLSFTNKPQHNSNQIPVSNAFTEFLNKQMNTIQKSEEIISQPDASMTSIAHAVNDAEIAVKMVQNTMEKIIAGWNSIINSAL